MAPSDRRPIRPDSETGNFPEQAPRELPSWDELLNLKVEDPTGLEQSIYDFTSRIFPEDLTMQDNSHYMVININVPVRSDMFGGGSRSAYSYRTNILSNEYSKVDNLRFGNILSDASDGFGAGDRGQREAFSIPRFTRRIKESIALHMPNGGLVYTEDNKYEEASLTAMGGSLVSSLAKGISDSLSGKVATIFDVGTNVAGQVLKNGSKIAGYPINPRVEVLFATRPQRQWMFELFLAPRSASEAQTVREIIRTLRYHAAPELDLAGFAFVPPAEFDITFFRQGIENLNLPRINTCVLERIDIDYAPQSGAYSTFRDGSPVAVRLSLGFREIEIVHKRRVLEGF
jgi:hypothetical protein